MSGRTTIRRFIVAREEREGTAQGSFPREHFRGTVFRGDGSDLSHFSSCSTVCAPSRGSRTACQSVSFALVDKLRRSCGLLTGSNCASCRSARPVHGNSSPRRAFLSEGWVSPFGNRPAINGGRETHGVRAHTENVPGERFCTCQPSWTPYARRYGRPIRLIG